ncbi:cardiac-enriched FHL2-interacting protein [Ahaetulla prasina]|uniref:cardiac-enriched FHL2-interacting protein n=1 Tax=Ahaetulla prasina TaxID=499056 RepID=UPI002648C465|nr:cardiac-enriched FHL2-interacting protein [Ahaetulla prasina]XP_058041699.1 cardiac-enriched FHL2-interacting protein [Ahaetulla prasina]XP_058041700.1 cardiac-enriched FHL2-interacting protein [Ahaetulla prasina]XP_058041701.1 cardiac-enriched FHL2-interacting protein [Ahaetulla prasina]XP_058041702.1 cardiac-enriched FHL2-interacting protein [Ahaetulla prasina]
MQGNKKQAEGQSDSSSIGSLLDDADREVCSLTDRAFKSLCVAELQTPYTDVDPVVGPPNISHQFSSKFFHGPWDYALRKNTNFHKQLSKKEHATFLLSKVSTNSKTHEDKKCSIVNPSIRRKLDLPRSELHNCTHISKVSSLIKTFDKVDNQVSLLIARQPVNNSLTECPLICGDNMAFWSDKRILNIQKGISELPDPSPSKANPSDKRKGYSKIDLVYQSLPVSHPSQANVSNTPKFSISNKTGKTRSGKAKEFARKSSFLHSENSAFESWNAHHKKIIEMGETMPTDDSLGYFEETPFFNKPCISEPKPIGAFMLEESFSDDSSPKSLSKATLSSVPLAEVYFPSPADAKCTVAQQQLPRGLAPVYEGPSATSPTSSTAFPPRMSPSVPVSKAPVPLSPLPQVSVPPEAAFHRTDTQESARPHITELAEKTTKPEFAPRVGNGGPPPWRKQKTTLSRMKLAEVRAADVLEIKDSTYRKSPEAVPLIETAVPESGVILSDPSFSISALLTPVPPLKPKNEGSPGNRLLVVTPFILEAGATKEPEERAFYSQNDYKSKAPRLLFNLKDIRKRVKSTYSPSPLLRALEDKSKMKDHQVHLKATVMATSVLDDSNKNILGGTDKVNIFEQMDYIQEKDNFTSLNENFISDDVLLSLSKTRAGILKYQNKNHSQQSNSVYTEDVEMVSVHEHSKTQPAPLPKPHLTDVAAIQQEVVQEHKYKKVTLGQDADDASRNLFYPAEEKTSNHGTQACSSNAAGNDHKDKRSPSSSEQSFVTTADQPFHDTPCSLMQLFQKACLQESQRRKNDMDGREEQSSKEKEKAKKKDMHSHLLSNCDSAMDETDKEKNEKENVLREVVLEEKEKDGWNSTDREAESKPGEPLTPTLSSVLKPTLFVIKDNTFKSPPVTKAIKLPLLRSLSCEEATPIAQENPKNAEEEEEEDGWESLQGNRGLTINYSFSEGLDHFPMMADSEETDCLSVLPEKELKSPEKLTISKEKIRIRKLRSSSAIQPNLDFESEPRQSEERSPIRERIHYMKNRALTRQRGGPCIKKIISQEGKSLIVAENYAGSPVSSDAFGYTSSPLSNSADSALQSPRSDTVVPSASIGLLSDTTANVNISQTEKAANYPLHKATGRLDQPSTTPTFDPEQTGQLPGDADSPLGTNERLQLVGQMGRTTAKPPTVPPKTEKALRRAKKLASRRKKMEAQQKKLQDENLAQNEDASSLTPVQSLRSLVCPDSLLTAPKCDLIKHQPLLSVSPTPSLPATQRKLLQDPDSGEYFMVDLPLRLKMFYDPESGRYIQVSVPSSKRNLSQTPSSEMFFSPCAWGPSTLPPRVASVPALPSSAQLSETFTKASGLVSDEQPEATSPGSLDGPPCPDSALLDIHSQNVDGSPSNFGKDMSTLATTENVSMGSAEEFAVEGIL